MDRTVNQIAKTIISLHEEGYQDDFVLYDEVQLRRVQGYGFYDLSAVNINKICKVTGQGKSSVKFILAIETVDGFKGLLIGNNSDQGFYELSGEAITEKQKHHSPFAAKRKIRE